jgi:hypothetical protein
MVLVFSSIFPSIGRIILITGLHLAMNGLGFFGGATGPAVRDEYHPLVQAIVTSSRADGHFAPGAY